MNFHSFGDESGDDEIMFSMNFVVFMNTFSELSNSTGHLVGQDFTISKRVDYIEFLKDEFREWLCSEAGVYLKSRVAQSMIHAVRAYNSEQDEYSKRLKMLGQSVHMISGACTNVSWYMNKVDATVMKLKFA